MHGELRGKVVAANLELAARSLAQASFGDVSGIDRDVGVLASRPCGVLYADLRVENVSLADTLLERHFRRKHGPTRTTASADLASATGAGRLTRAVPS
jgi:ribulose-5-phosphate 4-epimerase/fuculose-1-phosphate aldolase